MTSTTMKVAVMMSTPMRTRRARDRGRSPQDDRGRGPGESQPQRWPLRGVTALFGVNVLFHVAVVGVVGVRMLRDVTVVAVVVIVIAVISVIVLLHAAVVGMVGVRMLRMVIARIRMFMSYYILPIGCVVGMRNRELGVILTAPSVVK